MASPLAAVPPSMKDLLLCRCRRAPPLRFQLASHRRGRASRFFLRSVSEDRMAVTEPAREKKELDSYGWNGNGNRSGMGLGYEVMERGPNERMEVVVNGNGTSNGTLVKYEGGNGAVRSGDEEGRRKKRVEEIGKEDAWFKTSRPQPQVSVTPGGRWSRFKTYSTIQRTVEIWGGMTEEKKVLRRKALAKWLKESILRLGPTFIKIGQQFSTRVDILAQEYVDQLSELQVKILVDHMIHAPITP